jgi:uncharacterized protein (TIGR02996 family)
MPPRLPPADTTLAALYQAVLANPDDDLPRLVYADRLDELGDHARAEFIRLQVHVANTKPWDDGHADALARADALLDRHRDEWGVADFTRELVAANQWPPNLTPIFARGFPELARVNLQRITAAQRAALARHPVRTLLLSGGTPAAVGRAAEVASAVRPHTLDLVHTRGGVLAALAAGPPLPSVRRVRLCCEAYPPSAQVVEWLAGCGAFPNAEAVHFQARYHAELLAAFVRGLRWPKVREVSLVGRFDPPVVETLARAGWLPQVETLSLHHEDDTYFDEYDDQGVVPEDVDLTPLLHLRLRNLRAVELRGFAPLPRGPAAFAALRRLGPLEQLALYPNHLLTADDFRGLFDPPWGSLRSLHLPYLTADVDAAEVGRLVGRHDGLRLLNWAGLGGSQWAIEALAASPASQSLRRLLLGYQPFDQSAVAALLAGRAWPNLAELICGHGRHDGREVARLIDHPHFARLTHLAIGYGVRGGELWRRLARSNTVGRFHKLQFGFAITDKQLSGLLDNPAVGRVGRLALLNRVKIARGTQRRYEKTFGVKITRPA